jgi:AraC family transcriptional regulator
MDGQYRTTTTIALPQLRLERVVQAGSGPFRRAHLLDVPSLVYLPPGSGAMGCFGTPRSHRSFTPFGAAVVVPAHTPLHVRSPGFGAREMIVARFDEARFGALTGIGAGASETDLAACADVRARGVVETMERLSGELAGQARARETIVAGLGLVVLGELARYFEAQRATPRRPGGLADWQRARIEARLADGDRSLPDVAELAGLCGIGPRHLMRAWKATTGGTVMEHVERVRFTRALRLLESGHLPVKAVAGLSGFASQGSFASAFRRRFGETPSGWRARRRSS